MFLDEDELNEMKGVKAPVKTAVVKPELKKVVYRTFDDDELVHINRSFPLDGYEDFTGDSYPYSINFYDFEVFMGDWLVVIINPVEKFKRIIVNNSDELKKYYKAHKREIWCGYNSRNYDTFILRAILCGLNPKKVSDMIIVHGMSGWQISDEFKTIPIYDFDISTKIQGLKQLEGFMGNNIKETSVPFDIERPLTKAEVRETIKYCMHDVEQTIEVFRRRKAEYDAHMDLISTFDLPLKSISSTQAQLTAKILGCERVHDRGDEFDLQIVPILKIKKYKHILDWFKNPANYNYKNSLEAEICSVPHVFGWGGIHGCPEKPLHIKGKLFHVDVTSYYPSIMIEYDFLTRNCKDKKKFKQIYNKRVALKKAGKKKEQQPFKIILNSTYGICKDKFSNACDPRQANNVCINGQLMLLDLLEHLEGYAEIIQSNTDGIILQVEDDEKSVQNMRAICQEWMDRTKMGLGFDEIDEIWQKDVNNYIFRFTSGKLERKGAYVKELSELDNDLPIVNEAIVKYLTEDILPRETIEGCTQLMQFQKIVKVSSAYLYGWHKNEFLSDKTFRVFASKDKSDTYIGKCKAEGATIEKFANTPEHCFIENDDVRIAPVPEKLDREWYIRLAEKRIEDFGISLNSDALF